MLQSKQNQNKIRIKFEDFDSPEFKKNMISDISLCLNIIQMQLKRIS